MQINSWKRSLNLLCECSRFIMRHRDNITTHWIARQPYEAGVIRRMSRFNSILNSCVYQMLMGVLQKLFLFGRGRHSNLSQIRQAKGDDTRDAPAHDSMQLTLTMIAIRRCQAHRMSRRSVAESVKRSPRVDSARGLMTEANKTQKNASVPQVLTGPTQSARCPFRSRIRFS